MSYCKVLISETINTPYKYKFIISFMDKDNRECSRINIYAQNVYLNSLHKLLLENKKEVNN
ncbi:hypothetical protein DP145_11410 [Clostridium tetani]|uniref:Uncharacterized protein n=1 Tax=Clostridium tetani TaxID=1513 RepID=A0ABY0ENB0_CLOTA|nr:hypothetical protein [Clostridium tetani]RXI44880.1 hypothetical protein DP126_09810 [Clostridium tetani]RXI54014.1 hypothetical protein DP131_10705 [Clostridium tetani]RXI67163.1 hypothetical protein DQN76_11800 [Clostridium tetani]RXM60172.1 hypothetical protein DP138_09180 [Clostridium tetani]RXM65053.1 hypothetical protein DP145_11410 [Clostridium tetani]